MDAYFLRFGGWPELAQLQDSSTSRREGSPRPVHVVFLVAPTPVVSMHAASPRRPPPCPPPAPQPDRKSMYKSCDCCTNRHLLSKDEIGKYIRD
jgi:hypothetical protein